MGFVPGCPSPSLRFRRLDLAPAVLHPVPRPQPARVSKPSVAGPRDERQRNRLRL